MNQMAYTIVTTAGAQQQYIVKKKKACFRSNQLPNHSHVFTLYPATYYIANTLIHNTHVWLQHPLNNSYCYYIYSVDEHPISQ